MTLPANLRVRANGEGRGGTSVQFPSDTITLLFTDIEGSTRLGEERPGGMRSTLTLYDPLLHAAIRASGGTVFKTVGDTFCAAFAHASDALAAALADQTVATRRDPLGIGGGPCSASRARTSRDPTSQPRRKTWGGSSRCDCSRIAPLCRSA